MTKTNLLNITGLLFAVLFMSACGKGTDPAVATSAQNGACQAGYVQSQFGCLPQSNCPAGQALYNNVCTAITNTGVGGTCQAGYIQSQFGCLPQANCPAGQALYNNVCTAVTTTQQFPGQYPQQYPQYPGQYPQYPGAGGIGISGGFTFGPQYGGGCMYPNVQTSQGCLPSSYGPYSCPAGFGYVGNGMCTR